MCDFKKNELRIRLRIRAAVWHFKLEFEIWILEVEWERDLEFGIGISTWSRVRFRNADGIWNSFRTWSRNWIGIRTGIMIRIRTKLLVAAGIGIRIRVRTGIEIRLRSWFRVKIGTGIRIEIKNRIRTGMLLAWAWENFKKYWVQTRIYY